MSAASPFNMYFIYNHMFAAEFAWGYAGEKGAYQEGRLCPGSDKDDGSPDGGALSRQALVSCGVQQAHPPARLKAKSTEIRTDP